MDASQLINKLQLQPHPEGGYYKEIFRSADYISIDSLPLGYTGNKRNIYTSIYFLLQKNDFSAFHRIKSDELWYFHMGDPLEIFILENNDLIKITLGDMNESFPCFQAMIPKNCWFGAQSSGNEGYSLVSCVVAPGFDFADFEMAKQEQLLTDFSEYKELILKLSKE
ncbi:MAG: cupin domain-containing protein [Bacteroidota bacterium]|nr:cupin domain-containing protein [Bacteroidota bacterium]